MTSPARTDCVVDAHGGEVLIWHVNTGPDLGMPRMAGAWMINVDDTAKVKLLVEQRRVLATDEGKAVLAAIGVSVHEYIDAQATVRHLAAERDNLQAIYEAHPNCEGLVSPRWPSLPTTADLHNPPAVASDSVTGRALHSARWLEQVAHAWDRIEAQRLLRKFMPGGPIRRPMPLAAYA